MNEGRRGGKDDGEEGRRRGKEDGEEGRRGEKEEGDEGRSGEWQYCTRPSLLVWVDQIERR